MAKMIKRFFWASMLLVPLIGLGSPPLNASTRGGDAADIFRHAKPNTVSQYNYSLSGASESVPNASPGTGTGYVSIDSSVQTMLVSVSFANLVSGNTAAHIHCCTTTAWTGTAGVATTTPTFTGFPSGVTSGTYLNTLDMTLSSSYYSSFLTANGGTPSSAFAALIAGIAGGKAYFNIHTTTYPAGEIRGFLVVPYLYYLPLISR